MSPDELSHKGFKALVDSLGYVDAVRFIRQYNSGSGNYTQERHQWLDQLTTDEILADLAQRQNQEIPE
ncbi:hypothetical protein C7H19_18195 [Aphanothece hegewaldii CCALA 016]|uniref:Uncharacterized protein n=1 Tax=Aphanothece hegewaldii CCALA 016 TaxID=2107694 RepID=A0A2T1LU16_9CHRO|nr:hypothetical protein [Aphanothece hegewaldii]PSF34938.1 hypothetical protein C7H19_18195 [Aphanothece hegewaldii CCALA 016]